MSIHKIRDVFHFRFYTIAYQMTYYTKLTHHPVIGLLQIHHVTINRKLRLPNEGGPYRQRPGQRPKRCNNQIDDSFLRHHTSKDWRVTSNLLNNELFDISPYCLEW